MSFCPGAPKMGSAVYAIPPVLRVKRVNPAYPDDATPRLENSRARQ